MTRALFLVPVLLPMAMGMAARPPAAGAGGFISSLVDAGYDGIRLEAIEMDIFEPCTVALYSPSVVLGGCLAGMGGSFVLDLRMSIHGEGWTIVDTLPDDLPVALLDSTQIGSIRFIELTVLDMTHNARRDTVYFVAALDLPPRP